MKRFFPVVLLILAVSLSLALAGCGDDEQAQGDGKAQGDGTAAQPNTGTQLSELPDPCTVITRADAEELLGEATGAPASEVEAGQASCSYPAAGDPNRKVSLQLVRLCSMADFMNYTPPGSEMVEGIGMHAYWDKTVLTVHTTANICIMASGGGAPQDGGGEDMALENAKRVANMAIEKLGIQEPM